MSELADGDLQDHQREVQRLLGRCMLRLQQYERLGVDHLARGRRRRLIGNGVGRCPFACRGALPAARRLPAIAGKG